MEFSCHNVHERHITERSVKAVLPTKSEGNPGSGKTMTPKGQKGEIPLEGCPIADRVGGRGMIGDVVSDSDVVVAGGEARVPESS